MQQILPEIAKLRPKRDQLEDSIRRQTGDDLSPLSTKDLDNLQKELESALGKVRKRKVCTRPAFYEIHWSLD